VVGLALAALLCRERLHIAVIESQPTIAADGNVEYDLRTLALTHASASILRAAGAWTHVLAKRHGCFRRMEVWDEHSQGRIRFDSAQLAEPTLGYIVEQRLLRTALEQALRERANVLWHRPASLCSCSVGEERLILKLAGGEAFATRLLVGADGAESNVRTLAGIGYARHDYRQEALVCNVRTELAHADTARQRFLSTGPLAFLPLGDPHLCSVVWSTSPEEARGLTEMETPSFCVELARAFDHALGRITAVGERAVFPLFRAHAERYVQSRLALVGDAAHTIHPLAGQGANLGLLDAAALAEVVTLASARNGDIGSLRTLRRYERWRKGENLLMQTAMDGFKNLFGSRQPALQWLRGMGLNLTDRCWPAKEVIMRRAMGLAGDLPATARAV
jgi:2-octaprenylphenol hydroxylase